MKRICEVVPRSENLRAGYRYQQSLHVGCRDMAEAGRLLVSRDLRKDRLEVLKRRQNERRLDAALGNNAKDVLIKPRCSMLPYKRVYRRIRISRPRKQYISAINEISFIHLYVGELRLRGD